MASGVASTFCENAFAGFAASMLEALRVVNSLDYPCTNRSDLVGLDKRSLKQPHRTTTGTRSPAARVPLYSVQVIATRKSTPRLRRVSVTAGRVFAES